MVKALEIINTWGDLTLEDKLAILASDKQKSLSEVEDGKILHFKSAVYCSDNDRAILFIKTEEGWFATVSSTFIESFIPTCNILDDAGMMLNEFTVERGRSKKGRSFMVFVRVSIVEKEDK